MAGFEMYRGATKVNFEGLEVTASALKEISSTCEFGVYGCVRVNKRARFSYLYSLTVDKSSGSTALVLFIYYHSLIK